MVIVINDHKTLQIVTNHHNYSRLFIDSQIINSVHYYIVKYCECMKCMKCVKCMMLISRVVSDFGVKSPARPPTFCMCLCRWMVQSRVVGSCKLAVRGHMNMRYNLGPFLASFMVSSWGVCSTIYLSCLILPYLTLSYLSIHLSIYIYIWTLYKIPEELHQIKTLKVLQNKPKNSGTICKIKQKS